MQAAAWYQVDLVTLRSILALMAVTAVNHINRTLPSTLSHSIFPSQIAPQIILLVHLTPPQIFKSAPVAEMQALTTRIRPKKELQFLSKDLASRMTRCLELSTEVNGREIMDAWEAAAAEVLGELKSMPEVVQDTASIELEMTKDAFLSFYNDEKLGEKAWGEHEQSKE